VESKKTGLTKKELFESNHEVILQCGVVRKQLNDTALAATGGIKREDTSPMREIRLTLRSATKRKGKMLKFVAENGDLAYFQESHFLGTQPEAVDIVLRYPALTMEQARADK
jgi:hypothetical protein